MRWSSRLVLAEVVAGMSNSPLNLTEGAWQVVSGLEVWKEAAGRRR